MFKQAKIKSKYIVFSRWSRKGYAVYASLRKIVIVAQLSVDMCKAALQKNSSVIQLLSNFCIADINTEEFELNELDEAQQLQLIPVTVSNNDPLKNKSIKKIDNPYFVFQCMGFFVFVKLIKRNIYLIKKQ